VHDKTLAVSSSWWWRVELGQAGLLYSVAAMSRADESGSQNHMAGASFGEAVHNVSVGSVHAVQATWSFSEQIERRACWW
jgi:hypothetical protein